MADNILSRLVVKPQMARRGQRINTMPAARLPAQPQSTQKVVKRAAVQPTISRPARAAPAPAPIPVPVPVPVPAPSSRYGLHAVVQKQRSLKKQAVRRAKEPRHITADVSAYEQAKARNVRGLGSGRILLIIGNGPSVNEVPLDLLKDHPKIDIMSINRPDSRLWPTAYWAFFDQSQLRRHRRLWDDYGGVTFNSTSIKDQNRNSIKIKNLGGFGFSLDLMRGLHIGRSSVYAAMQIALWMDFRHVYIFGCDMCEVDGKTHFYGENPDAPRETRLNRFAKEAEYYDDAAEKLDEQQRGRFTFCSTYNTYGFVDKFGRMDQREAVPLIMGHANRVHRKGDSDG